MARYHAGMCARIDQNQTPRQYALASSWALELGHSQAPPQFNVCPGTWRPVMHKLGGQARIDDMFWGYRPGWAAGKLPVAANARLEKSDGSYWGALFRRGRVIIPADGWYEWTGAAKAKQPWHIHDKQHAPIFLAGVAAPGALSAHQAEHPEEFGFVIVTYGAEGSLVDLHSRRPLVFDAQAAALWLDLDLPVDQALHLAHSASLPTEAFAFHQVDRAVGTVSEQGAHLAQPVFAPSLFD